MILYDGDRTIAKASTAEAKRTSQLDSDLMRWTGYSFRMVDCRRSASTEMHFFRLASQT